MSIPSNIQSRLSDPNSPNAARFVSSVEAKNFEAELQDAGISYQTRIVKHKKRGREFVVTVLEVPVGA